MDREFNKMKFAYNKIDGTLIIGISFSSYYNKQTNKKHTFLIFDLGKHSFVFIFRGEY
jgi:hypothetical protein